MVGIAVCALGVAEGIGRMVEGDGGSGVGGSHMFTQNTAKGYQLPISINSSGLASLDASGGWGQCYPCVSSQPAVRQRQRQIITKRKGQGI